MIFLKDFELSTMPNKKAVQFISLHPKSIQPYGFVQSYASTRKKSASIFFILLALLLPDILSASTIRKTERWPGGKQKAMIFYKDNQEVAKIEFDKNENVIQQSGIIPDGEVREYYTGKEYAIGQPEPSKAFWVGTYLNGKLHGTCTNYYAPDEILRIATYKAGVLNGVVKQYWETGGLETETLYIDGKIEGKNKSFYRDGQLRWEGEYRNGELILEKEFYENGKVQYEIPYKNGEKHGVARSFYEDGQIKSISHYEYGKLIKSKSRKFEKKS